MCQDTIRLDIQVDHTTVVYDISEQMNTLAIRTSIMLLGLTPFVVRVIG